MKELVVNADDFGKSEKANRRIKKAIERGSVTGVSIMFNMDYLEAVDEIQVSRGVHLNITEGRPLSDSVKTLVDGTGNFLGLRRFLLRYFTGRIDPVDLKKEFRAQMERAEESMDDYPDHLDTHHHVHILPGIYEVIETEAESRKIDQIRCTREVIPMDASYIRNSLSFSNAWRFLASTVIKPFLPCSSKTGFAGILNMGQWDSETMKSFLSANQRDHTELCVHPEVETDFSALTDSDVIEKMREEYNLTGFN